VRELEVRSCGESKPPETPSAQAISGKISVRIAGRGRCSEGPTLGGFSAAPPQPQPGGAATADADEWGETAQNPGEDWCLMLWERPMTPDGSECSRGENCVHLSCCVVAVRRVFRLFCLSISSAGAVAAAATVGTEDRSCMLAPKQAGPLGRHMEPAVLDIACTTRHLVSGETNWFAAGPD